MAFPDSQSVTVGAATVALARTGMSLTEGRYASADRKYDLKIMHSNNKRYRHVAQLKFSDVVQNELAPDRKIPVQAHAHLVVDLPINGVASTTAVDLAKAIVAWATPANLAKLIASES